MSAAPRRPAALLPWSALLCLLLVAGCAGPQVVQPLPTDAVPTAAVEERVLQEVPGPRPQWVDRIPDATEAALFFVGQSGTQVQERDARNDALRDAVNQFARYCGVDVQVVDEYLSVAVGRASGVIDPTVSQKRQERQATDAFVSRVKSQEWYSRRLERVMGSAVLERGWQAWALVSVPRDEVAQVQDFQAERRAREEEARVAPHVERYAHAVKLRDVARDLQGEGRPLAALEAYSAALAAHEAALDMDGFAAAVPVLKASGLTHPLPVEAELRTLLAGLRLQAQTPPQRLLPGTPLEQALQVAVRHEQQPVAGATILFSGSDGEVRRTSDDAGVASYHPAGSEAWTVGNRTYTARLLHPALEDAATRFSVPDAVQLAVDVRPLSGAERREHNRQQLDRIAARLAAAAHSRLGSGGAPGVAVLPGSEGGQNSELGVLLAQALEAALASQEGVTVRSSSEALRGAGPGADSGSTTAVVLVRLRVIGEAVQLGARLVRVDAPTVVTAEEARLWLTADWRAARQAPASGVTGVGVAANFFYYPPHSRPQPIENGMTLRSGHRYQVSFEPAQQAYIYAYQVDSSGVTYPLFPNPEFSPLANPVPARELVVLPAAEWSFELDAVPGTEELVVVASREPLPQIQGLWESLRAGQQLTAAGEGRRELRVDVQRETLDLALEILNNPAVGTVQRVKFLHQ